MDTFTIDRVGWHTKDKGNPETRDRITHRFGLIAKFLDNKGLSNSPLAQAEYTDDFSIRACDLTEEGLAFMKFAYDSWLKSLDRRKSAADTSLLEKRLSEFRAKE